MYALRESQITKYIRKLHTGRQITPGNPKMYCNTTFLKRFFFCIKNKLVKKTYFWSCVQYFVINYQVCKCNQNNYHVIRIIQVSQPNTGTAAQFLSFPFHRKKTDVIPQSHSFIHRLPSIHFTHSSLHHTDSLRPTPHA